MTINAGDLNRRLHVQADAAPSRGQAGESQPAWVTLMTVWASVKPTMGKQIIAGGTLSALGSVSIGLRWRPDLPLTPALRFVDSESGAIYQINHVADVDTRHREWQVVATQSVPL